jgi:hypothetical protein
MSAMSESIRRAKERAAQEKAEIEGLVVIAFAALFRAAGIAREPDRDALGGNQESYRNTLAIEQAQEFLRSCKQHGIWPKDP